MASLQQFTSVKIKIASAKTAVIKATHKFIFESEGDRCNRKRLREFVGFTYNKSDEKYKKKVEYVKENLTQGDLVSICNLLELNYEADDLIVFVFDNLQKGNLLKDREEEDENIDENDENEDDAENVSIGNFSYKDKRVITNTNVTQNMADDEDVNINDDNADNGSVSSFTVAATKKYTHHDNCKTRFAISFKDIEDSVRTFNGDETLHVEKWVQEFEEISEVMGLDSFQKYVLAKKSLRGIAKLFISSERNIMSWTSLKNALLNEFKTTTNSAKLHKIMSERKIRKDESVQEYFFTMRELASRGNIEDGALFQYVIDGIRDLNVNKTILYGAKNVEEFKVKLKCYNTMRDKNQSEAKKFEIKKPSKNEASNIKTELICYNCGERGHKSVKCENKGKGTKCFACNKFGHLSRNCTEKKEENSKSNFRRLIDVSRNMMNKRIKIKNQSFFALFDTGSEFNVMTYEAYCKILKPKTVESKLSLVGFGDYTNNRKIKPLGNFCHEIEIDDDVYNLVFHVVPTNCMDIDIVLGTELCKYAEIKIDANGVKIQKLTETGNENEIVSIMNIKVIQKLDDIDIDEKASNEARRKVLNLIENYKPQKEKTTNVTMNIILKEDTPIHSRPRRLPFSEQQAVESQIEEWLKDGIIEPCYSEFCSPVVVVKKRDGTPRICIDFRKINKVIVKDRFPLPLIEDQLDRLQEARIFSTLDLKNGFFHVDVNKESRQYTSFVTHSGQYQFLKVPFGLSNSPGVFQRHVNCIFRQLTNEGIALPYIDDIIVPAKNEKEAVERLDKVIELCRQYGLEINRKKCHFLKKKIEFLGHIIENGQVSPSTDKIKAVLQFPLPKTLKKLESFLGLASYFRKFMPQFALIAKPLTDLRKQNKKFIIEEKEIESFNNLKKLLSEKPVLNIYNHTYETEVHTDACAEGYGAVLLQKSPEDLKLHPVYYMSKKTNDQQKAYSSYELEVLAIIEALKKFRVYLLGIKFKLVTDCNAFTKTLEKKDLGTRVARWILFLEEYDYEVEHRSGSKMKHVDALSRNPIMIISADNVYINIKRAQNMDNDVQMIKEILKTKPYEDYFIKNEVLYKFDDGREQLVIPKGIQTDIIKQAHERGHFALKKTKEFISKDYYIPKLDEKIQRCITNCVSCIISNRKRGKQEGELHPLHKEETPLYTYHIDFLGPLESTSRSYKHIFAVIDAFTKFVWLYPTRSTTAKEAISKLDMQKNIFGNPSQIISDKGSAFTSDEFKEYCEEEQIQHIKITTGLPRSNGQVERLNSVIIAVLSKYSEDDPAKWYKHVARVQQVINSTFHRSIQRTPFEMLVGIKMKTKEDVTIKELIEEEMASSFLHNREELRKKAKQQILKTQEENKKTYNLRRKPATKYKQDDLVVIKRTQLGGGLKLKAKYLGPYRITKVKMNNSYDVTREGGSEGPKHTTTCAEFMKPWVNSQDNDSFGSIE